MPHTGSFFDRLVGLRCSLTGERPDLARHFVNREAINSCADVLSTIRYRGQSAGDLRLAVAPVPLSLRQAVLPDAHSHAQRLLEAFVLLALHGIQDVIEYYITGTLDFENHTIAPVITSVSPCRDRLIVRLHPDAAIPLLRSLIPHWANDPADYWGVRGLCVDFRRRALVLRLWQPDKHTTAGEVVLGGLTQRHWGQALAHAHDTVQDLKVLDPTRGGKGASLSGEVKQWPQHPGNAATIRIASAVLRRFAPLRMTTLDVWDTNHHFNVEIGKQKHISTLASEWRRPVVGLDPYAAILDQEQPLDLSSHDAIRFCAADDKQVVLLLRQLDFPAVQTGPVGAAS